MNRRITADRRNEITQMLLRDGNLKASELASRFQVSTETIRKDLIYLEEQGIAQKSYGGAVVCNELLERPLAIKELENRELKTAIADKALSLIPDNGVIFLDTGSTAYSLAKLLPLRKDLTIFTNSIIIMGLLADSENELYALGGHIRGSNKGIIGSWTNQAVQSIHVDVAFLGSDGFKDQGGPSTAAYEECELKKLLIAHSTKAVVLADSSKFSGNCIFQYCGWEDIYALVTNLCKEEEVLLQQEKIGQVCKIIFSE